MATMASAIQAARDPTLTDADVVRRVLAGETALFEVLMRRHNQRAYRAVRAILRDETEAEEAMQQAYLAAFAHLAQFNGEAAFSTWLIRIAVNEALLRVRRRSRFAAIPEDEAMEDSPALGPMPPLDPEHHAATRELATLLEAAVDELPEGYRTVFMLREVEGLSTAEAAQCLGISEDAAKVRLHRARLALRDRLYETVGSAAGEAFPFHAPRCDRVVAAVLARIFAGQVT